MKLANRKIIFTGSLIAISFFVIGLKIALATSTLRGRAWGGDEYQSIYFNCLDDKMGDYFDTPGNLNSLPTPRGFHFSWIPCTSNPHKVLISDNGNFSGAAWSYYKGLISFEGVIAPPDGYAFNAHCPNTCNASNNCWACYNENDQTVYGWARASDSSWISMAGTATLSPVIIKSWNPASSTLPGQSVASGDFVGYASSSFGTVSFNCENTNQVLGTACYVPNSTGNNGYKVWIYNLQVGYMTAPSWGYNSACSQGALNQDLQWEVKSGNQSGFEVVVATGNTFNTSTNDYVCWSGVQMNPLAHHYLISSYNSTCPNLTYNTAYHWWVRLYDDTGSTTPWYPYGSVAGSGGATTFTTYKHEFPSPFFSWSPYISTNTIMVGTTTNFISNSKYSVSNNTYQNCASGTCSYLWSTNDSGATIGATTSATTAINFMHATNTSVTLRVTDNDSYVCSTSTTFTINYGLPLWHEVKAKIGVY